MTEFENGWALDVEVTPEWLFLVLCHAGSSVDPAPPLAEHVWQMAEQHSIYRFVLELGAGVVLTSHLIGQLVLLLKRVCQKEGTLRICGLAHDNYAVLQVLHVADRFPYYGTREDAVMGRRS